MESPNQIEKARKNKFRPEVHLECFFQMFRKIITKDINVTKRIVLNF